MSIFEEMAKSVPEMDRMKLQVLPDDDITKAVWRFERSIIEAPLESSQNWEVLALRLGIFDPFQMADSTEAKTSYITPVYKEYILQSNSLGISLFILSPEGTVFSIERQYRRIGEEWSTYGNLSIDTVRQTGLIVEGDYMDAEYIRRSEHSFEFRVNAQYFASEFEERMVIHADRIYQQQRRLNIPTGEVEHNTEILRIADYDWKEK